MTEDKRLQWKSLQSNSITSFKMESGSRVNMSAVIVLLFCIILQISVISGRSNQYVTCGSIIKLMNTDIKVRLHSHDVKYGTGSGQQSVTGTEVQEDVNSHWTIKAPTGEHCTRGEPLKCGDVIRLTHLSTKKNLHSHHFPSPLSGEQEISAYGDENGIGDTGDHWMIMCEGDFWDRNEAVMLKHMDTAAYLSVTSRTYGRPINGQAEIVGVMSPTVGHVYWKAMEGLFIHPSDFNPKAQHIHSHHTEL